MGSEPNPYVGPSPFKQRDSDRFYGRAHEANELFSLACAHSVVLFYSQSGAGKTSLINAGVIPKLITEQISVFPVARVGIKLQKGIKAKKISNVFLFNTLLSLEGKKEQQRVDHLFKMSLADYLKKQFSNGEPEDPYTLRVLIFDQFEELFTNFPERWEEREPFFISIREALKQDPLLRIVFAMREEYVAELEPFAPMLPLRFQKRFRLERLRKEAAKDAIEGPVKNTGWSYAKDVAEGLVDNLLQQQIKYTSGTRATPGEFVEPVQLQIVCRSLWEELHKKERPENLKVIDQTAVSQYGDIDAALAKYYNNCLAKIVAEPSTVNEAGLRLWFQQALITPVNTRATAYVDEGSTKGVSDETLAKLEEERLIRLELRGGAKWYELTHDRFIEPILEANDEWFESRTGGGSFIYELEQRAINWQKGGRKLDANALLPDHTVRKFRNLAKLDDESKKIAPTSLLDEYVNASETAAVRRKSKEFRNQVIIYVALGALAAGLIVYSIISRTKIREAKHATETIQKEKGQIAKDYATQNGRELNGLIIALDAAALSPDPKDVPAEVLDGLRATLTAVDRRVWLRYTIGSASRAERLQLSGDGRLALTVNTNELCVWDTLTGQRVFDCIARNETGVWGKAQFSPDGNFVYALVKPLRLEQGDKTSSSRGGQDSGGAPANALQKSFVWVVDTRTGESKKQLEGIDTFQISNDSQHVLADFGVGKGGVQVIDVKDGKPRKPSPENQDSWYQMALSPDGSYLVAVYSGPTIELLATDSNRSILFNVGIQRNATDQISFSPDGKYGALVRPSASEGSDAAGLVWENSSGNVVRSFKCKTRNADYVAFSSDSSLLLISDNTKMEVLNIATGDLVSKEGPKQARVLHAGFKTLFLQNNKGTYTISVWETEPMNEYSYVTKGEISMAATSASGNRVIIVDEDKTIQIWNLVASVKIDDLDGPQLITQGCSKIEARKSEFPQFEGLCSRASQRGN